MNRSVRLLRSFVLGLTVLVTINMPAKAQNHSLDIGGTYTYVRTNLLPDCDCFSTNGGSGQVQFRLTSHLSLLGDITVTHSAGVTVNQYDLTQTIFAGGVRYFPTSGYLKIQPFGDVLLGGAHAGGTLSPANTGYGRSTTFAFQTGGGVQYPLSRRWTLMPIQAEYLLTNFGNGADNRQNDLRLSVGVLFRLHR